MRRNTPFHATTHYHSVTENHIFQASKAPKSNKLSGETTQKAWNIHEIKSYFNKFPGHFRYGILSCLQHNKRQM